MTRNEIRYTFLYIKQCNLCGSPTDRHTIMGKRLNGSQGKNPRSKVGITTTVLMCTECGLIYSNPQPIPGSISDHYGIPPEEYWNKDYFQSDQKYFAQEIATLKKLHQFHEKQKALDIGAGLGKCMIALEKAGYDAFGFEPSEPFYRRAIDQMKINPDKLRLASIESADYSVSQFDFITFGAVLEHLYDPSSAIVKAMTWLKPGGIMHIEVPSSDWFISKLFNLYYKIRGLDYVTNISPMHEPFHLYEFTLKSFQKHAALNSYSIAHHEYYVAQTYLPKVVDWIVVPYMRATNKGMQLCVWLKK